MAAKAPSLSTFTWEGTDKKGAKIKGEINGQNRSYFCGAYWYNGFHEDGVRSAVDVAAMLGVKF